MKLSENNLQEYIQLYLNDVEDYDSPEQYMLTENVLEPIKELIIDSENDPMEILLEIRNKADDDDKKVIDDFILYLNNV